jgi:hypothetical protein
VEVLRKAMHSWQRRCTPFCKLSNKPASLISRVREEAEAMKPRTFLAIATMTASFGLTCVKSGVGDANGRV